MRARRAVTRFASETGATGIHVGGACLVGEVPSVTAEAVGAGLAERHGATLLLPLAGTPWGVPSPREAAALLEAFAGAPLAPLWDPGQLSLVRALDLPLSDDRARALAGGAGGAIENDAVGMQ